MKSDLIIEISTEELPAKFIVESENNINNIFKSLLDEYNFEYKNFELFITPRRIVIFVYSLSEFQKSKLTEIQGPPAKVFYDEKGNLTETAKNFIKSKGITIKDISVKETQKGKYVFILKKEKGDNIKKVLPGLIEKFINSIPIPKSMKWDDSNLSFIRPIRGIVCVYNQKVIKFKIGNIISRNYTYGNKYISPKKIQVKNISKFKTDLKNNYVMLSSKEREEIIKKEISRLLKDDFKIEEDQSLLDEVANIVEYPFIQLCQFNENFLSIPKEIICTAIKHHQKAFPVYDKNGNLTNNFIVIVNNFPNKIIKNGNERVLAARLNDAKFLFEQDRKYGRLLDFNNKITQILFLTDMGNMLDKCNRIIAVSKGISEILNLSENEKLQIERCALLCKSDLATNIVYEFPELQGVCGRIYALLDNEDKVVAQGIEEHYKPKNVNDTFPVSLPGIVVSIADKIDSITGCFIKNLIPTGSYDPYQLRRFALAIINIIIKNKLNLSLHKIIEISFQNYYSQNLVDLNRKEEVIKNIIEFFKNRLKTVLSESNILPDEIDAILSVEFDDIYDSYLRVNYLHSYRENEEFKKLLIALKRMSNILKGLEIEGDVNEELLIENAEKMLYQHHYKNKNILENYFRQKEYISYYKTLSTYKDVVDKFFDEVLVMTEDEKIRLNRLRLLKWIVNDFKFVIDFSKISEKI